MKRILCVVGARPNFVKISPIIHEMNAKKMKFFLVHTGQHYDEKMSDGFFDVLQIPKPDVNLNVGSSSHAQQTAEIIRTFEPVLVECDPEAVLVVGDVNSTLACSLVAKKLGYKVVHVESGLRSFDEAMPEEINRVLTDHISDVLFVTEKSGMVNLKKEGVKSSKTFFVGNVMIDSIVRNLDVIKSSKVTSKLGLENKKYFLLTLHRPSNVDSLVKFSKIIKGISAVEKETTIVFPAHPRTKNLIEKNNFTFGANFKLIDPVSYIDFLNLTLNAKAVFTDSGGIQEETTFMKIPCITLRENTERPVTISVGTNVLVDTFEESAIKKAYQKACKKLKRKAPPKWDGKAAQRIVKILADQFGK